MNQNVLEKLRILVSEPLHSELDPNSQALAWWAYDELTGIEMEPDTSFWGRWEQNRDRNNFDLLGDLLIANFLGVQAWVDGSE